MRKRSWFFGISASSWRCISSLSFRIQFLNTQIHICRILVLPAWTI